MANRTGYRRAIVALPLCVCLMVLAESATAVNHVIHISIDGLRGDLLEAGIETSPQDYPNFKRFVDEGATTFNARTDYTNTETLPNHTSMLTGRPVDRPSEAPNTTHHGYVSNGNPGISTTLHNAGNPNLSYVASTFDIAHDNGLSTGLYASKPKFVIYDQSYTATTGAPDVTGPDNGQDKIDFFVEGTTGHAHVNFVADMAANQFGYSFLHYADLDGIGHNTGWGTPTWNGTMGLMDFLLGEVFTIIENNAGLTDDTIMIVTADHGGVGTGHGDATQVENYTIPVLVWGSGVAPGTDLYDLNPTTRLDPGTGRPSYNATAQPIRNGDTANLALDLLGLVPVEGSTINALQDLAVASPFAADFDGNVAVNADDLSIWQLGYETTVGASKANGDANLDGSVNGIDFLIWQSEVGSNVIGAVSTIPEPDAAILAMLAVAACSTRLRP